MIFRWIVRVGEAGDVLHNNHGAVDVVFAAPYSFSLEIDDLPVRPHHHWFRCISDSQINAMLTHSGFGCLT